MRRGYKRIVATLASVIMAGSAVLGCVQSVSAQTAETTVEEENAYSNYKQVCAGGYHSAVVTESGALYTWGYNGNGQLGDGTQTDSLVGLKVLENVAYADFGNYHSGAVTTNGDLYMWGRNYEGQLGNGATSNSLVPVKVMENVAAVSAGKYHSGAIATNGDLYMWGENYHGKLGNGTTTESYLPVKVMENAAKLSLGNDHSAAITTNGDLYLWGYNYYGQLGNGTTNNSTVPVKIMENVAEVCLGYYHSAAITKNGDLYLWGNNEYGQLGDGTETNSKVPVKVMENVAAVSLGSYHSAAVTTNGDLYLWGLGVLGELGNGTEVNSNVPVKIMENVAGISLGSDHSAAIKTNGDLYLWGYNYRGQLGDGTTENSLVPIKITITLDPSDYIKSFVTRLYTNILERAGDAEGINTWVKLLMNGTQNGATVSYGFIFSNEFASRGLTNEQKVEIFYNTFLNRAADTDGKKIWVDALDAGVDLEKIFEGFVMSTEFAGICEAAGISAGQMSDIDGMTDILNRYRNRSISLTEFIARCYTRALGRAGDIAGIDSWCMQILTGAWTPRNVAADGFFHSDEFIAKNTTNAEYVSILYQTFLGRELDAPGYELWVGLLDRNEWTRDQVLDGFADSEEFKAILTSFGLN
ncbi:MAG: DUF4214 domain-containing protein [Lachnospiraceae bacterium]